MATLEAICRRVISTFQNNKKYKPNEDVDFTQTVFAGLLACKDILEESIPAAELRASFSLRETPEELSEYMVNFVWYTYPRNRRFKFTKELVLPAGPYEVILAAESEAGKWQNKNLLQHYPAILEDFVKLLDVRSRIKIMVYRVPHNNVDGGFAAIKDGFEYLLQNHRHYDAQERWLFIGVPWYAADWAPSGLNARVHVIAQHSDQKITLEQPRWDIPGVINPI